MSAGQTGIAIDVHHGFSPHLAASTPGGLPERTAMSESMLGVGIIGVSPVRGWAATAHIPALLALPNYEIRALSAHTAESARAAGEAFGVNAVFSDYEQLMTQQRNRRNAPDHRRRRVSRDLSLDLWGARGRNEPAELAVPAGLTQKWPALASLLGAPAYNVGRTYAAFAADIANGTHTVPDFADAAERHEVIAVIERSAASGQRVKAPAPS